MGSVTKRVTWFVMGCALMLMSCPDELPPPCHSNEACSDDDPCTRDWCAPKGCINEEIVGCDVDVGVDMLAGCSSDAECDDGDLCTVDRCDGVCTNEPVECPTSDACTTDSCDPESGECVSEPLDCDDGDPCTTAVCDVVSGCSYALAECSDDEICFDGGCVPSVCTNIVAPETTVADATHPTALICDPGNAVALDGQVAGLAYASGGTLYEVDGSAVSACVRADFGELTAVGAIRVVAQGVQEICGDSCIGEVCGSWDGVLVFASDDGGTTFTRKGHLPLSTRSLQPAELPATGSVDSVLVCRSGGGHGRDNIALDFIALCAP